MAASEPESSCATNPLVALLRRCVVRIDAGETFVGSGFFVAPGEVLTCAHVVHGAEAITVRWEGGSCSAAVTTRLPDLAADDPAARFYPLPDVALLHLVDPPADHPCVRLETAEPVTGPPADVLRLDAYTKSEHAAGAVVHSSATLHYEGPLDEAGWRLFKLKAGQVLGGFSGGPLLNHRRGSVCALVDSSRSERTDLGGFGVPLSTFVADLDGLRERNRLHHEGDDRWARAVEDERRLAAERAGERHRLALTAPLVELVWAPGDPPSDLLRARYGVVPFVGRQGLIDQMMLWRESDGALAVAVIGGAGGTGKTRTAAELCAEAERSGWTAGLLELHDASRLPEAVEELAEWPGRLYVAIDSAETAPTP